MRRNGHRIISKQGQKYELYRASWFTYHNFGQMYDSIGDKMVGSNFAIQIRGPGVDEYTRVQGLGGISIWLKATLDVIRPDINFQWEAVMLL